MSIRGFITAAAAVAAAVLVVAVPASAGAATGNPPAPTAFTAAQKSALLGIARDTWRFYSADVDPVTHLPLDNLGPGTVRGSYTSAANVGVYLWAIVAAHDLRLITTARADRLAGATLREVAGLKRYDGFMYQWYDTSNGDVLLNPGQGDCSETTPTQDNCWFVSAVDNGWYASGLIEVKQALPGVRELADSLLAPMDFSIFYDNRAQTDCNVNASLPGDPPTGQMHGGFYVDQGPASYWNSALYSDPRIAMYIGMGRHQMPGDVWWRSWRTPVPPRCPTDPPASGDPGTGYWHTYTDPQSGKKFPVWEGHYTYPGTTLTFVPTFGGGMFEGLMANLVVPETTWGPHSFGLDDLRWAQVQQKYATQELGYPVWGMSPSSTADDTGDYSGFGVEGLKFGAGNPLAWCTTCATESTVTPHASAIALTVIPHQALSNLETLRTLYPGIYTSDGGFYDAVNPVTGQVGHRRLVLDQSMIMAAIDDAINGGAMQKHFAADPESYAAKLYLGAETMSIH
jgi:Putative glucoamylase